MWFWSIPLADTQLTEVQIGRYVAVGVAVGTAIGVIFTKLVAGAIRWKQGKSKISREEMEANQKAAEAEFDFQQRIDNSIEVARKKLVRDQDAQIKKLENKVDKLEVENDRCREDYQNVLADNIAQKRWNLDLKVHVQHLEVRMRNYEELMVKKGIDFVPFIIFRDLTEGKPKPGEGGGAGG
jgi:hypothetical protein